MQHFARQLKTSPEIPSKALSGNNELAGKSTNDGFEIAFKDLKLRGRGDLCGKQQSGNKDFYVVVKK